MQPHDASAATSRGFRAPASLPEELHHKRDGFYIVRMTDWEFDQMRLGTAIRLQRCDDGTYDAIAVQR